MLEGWISIHRKIEDNWIWKDKPFSFGQAWIDLILLANHKDKKELKNGKLQTYKAGTVNRSILWLSERWGWDRKKTTKFLELLKEDGMVAVNSTTHGTTVTLVKYEVYQYQGTTTTPTTTPTDGQPLPQPLPINNNDNNDNNENKKSIKRFIPPSVEEVKAYCQDRANGIDAEYYVNYNEARGWMLGKSKMKNWKANILTWERNEWGRKKTNTDTAMSSERPKYDMYGKLITGEKSNYEE